MTTDFQLKGAALNLNSRTYGRASSPPVKKVVEEVFGTDYNSLIGSTDALQKELIDSTTGFYKTNSAVSAENFLQQSQQLEQKIQENSG